MFPAAFPKPPTIQTARTNRVYDGWNVTISNLFFANGQRAYTAHPPSVLTSY